MIISFSGNVLVPSSTVVSLGYLNPANELTPINSFSASSFPPCDFIQFHHITNDDIESFGQVLVFSFEGFEGYSTQILPESGMNVDINVNNVVATQGTISNVWYQGGYYNKWEAAKVPEVSSCLLIVLTLLGITFSRKRR